MAEIKGRNVRVEVAKTYGSAKTISAVTKDDPGVATSTSHGLTAGTIGYMSDDTEGMVEIRGGAFSVDNPATDTLELEQENTSSYGTFTSGTFTPVTAWSTLAKATSYSIPNATAEELDATPLLATIRQTEAGVLAAQNVTIDQFPDHQSEAGLIIKAAALAGTAVVVRITHNISGERRIFRGVPSLPGESVSVGQIGSSQLTFQTKGRVGFLPA